MPFDPDGRFAHEGATGTSSLARGSMGRSSSAKLAPRRGRSSPTTVSTPSTNCWMSPPLALGNIGRVRL
jgi:hypothetical protein